MDTLPDWLSPAISILAGCDSKTPVSPSDFDSGDGRPAVSALPVMGLRNLTPNYASGVVLSRWAGTPTGLAISVSIDINRALPGLSSIAADNYLDGAKFGLSLWQSAMVVRFNVTINNPAAQIQVRLSDSIVSSVTTAQGVTRYTFGNLNGRVVITGAEIFLQRPNLKGAETLLTNRVWSQLQFNAFVAQLVAHEFGHALGIRGHSPSGANLMSEGGNRANGETDYTNWITPADANTLSHAY